jgi:membrane protein DedA with SNARE-associated domain
MENFIQEWGYIALFLYSFGGGMLALAIAGVFSFTGDLNIVYVIIVAVVSNFIGDQFLFLVAKNNKTYAKRIMVKYKRKLALAHLMMKRYGYIVIFLQKYIYGVKTLVPLAMGLTKYDTKKFIFFNILASIVWGLVVGVSSYMLGELFLNFLEDYKFYAIGIILILIFIIVKLFQKE